MRNLWNQIAVGVFVLAALFAALAFTVAPDAINAALGAAIAGLMLLGAGYLSREDY